MSFIGYLTEILSKQEWQDTYKKKADDLHHISLSEYKKSLANIFKKVFKTRKPHR